jgi:Mrp family chromosome partitioning ATPase
MAGLAGVRAIIAVSSCKGGVGKSMVAVNLAFSLAKRLGATAPGDARVGLFDADLYGPSLPTMVGLPPEQAILRESINGQGMVEAPETHGVKLMSYGYAQQQGDGGGAAVMRGPRASAMVTNLVNQTDWGALDVLVIDMPPGTGDIPLTLCQSLALTAAVVVTTPSQLAIVDVVKGMEMFDGLKVPVAALVENMSYFDADVGKEGDAGNTTKRFYPFGRGHVDRLIKERDVDANSVYSIPMHPSICEAADAGMPAVLSTLAASHVEPVFAKLADETVARFVVVEGAEQGTEGAVGPAPKVHFDAKRGIVMRYLMGSRAGTEHVIDPATLRRASRDALSIDEMSGEQLLKHEDVEDDIVPLRMTPQGNYGVAIKWDDGHDSGIYSYDMMEELAGK